MEEWRPAVGYEGVLSVSSAGEVRRGERAVPPQRGKRNQLFVSVRIAGRKLTLVVARLVARAFLGDPPRPTDCAVHVNRDPSDNRAENLKWAAHSGGPRGKQLPSPATRKLSDAQVVELRERAAAGERTPALAAAFGVSPSVVTDTMRGARYARLGGPLTKPVRGRPRSAVSPLAA